MDIINGNWYLLEVPEEFFKILKILGYSGLERKYVKRNKLQFTATLEDDVLTLKFDSTFYKKTKEFKLTGEPIEYQDDRKNSILEVAHWLDERSIHIKTMYLEKGLTILNNKKLNDEGNECHHELKLMSPDHPEIVVNLVYHREKK